MSQEPLPLIRPEAKATLWRWREVLVGIAIVALGGVIASGGGYFLLPLGAAIALAGIALAVLAWRRLRFAQSGEAPGVVQVVEGQVSYMGPSVGGFVGLPELAELRIIAIQGRRLWRLKQTDGQSLLIPMEAAGAETLFDAFASLPGLSSADLMAAVSPSKGAESRAVQAGGENRVVWRKSGAGLAPHTAH